MITSRTMRTAACPLVVALIAGTAMGEPEGERVVAGQASFVRDGDLTQIRAADNTIIDYRSFNIGANETVRFIQPGADARVLNRVLGQEPSRIDGSLLANGRVYLVNESGVFFGDRAVVRVGGLLAAAGTMTNDDFLGGVDRFSGLTGEIRNEGRIEADEVHFAGRRVTNLGSIATPGGLVTMTAGDDVLIGEHDGHVFVRAERGTGEGGVEQGGEIRAAGGRVMLGAGDLFSIVLQPESRVTGREIDVRAGKESVVRVSGRMDASSGDATGGRVTITGGGVAAVGATIDASGDAGGGAIRIGGGRRGLDASIEHADRVHVSRDSSLRADATSNGDGGEIIVWSDRATLFSGRASANGGASGGDGGFVEVSSPGWIGFFGRVATSATRGKQGLLLLDPENVRIVSGAAGSAADDSLLDDNQLPSSDAAGLDVEISDGTIESLTDTDILIAADGNISIGILTDGSLDLPVGPGNTFTFSAGGGFAFQGLETMTTAGGNIEIHAATTIQTAGINTNGGDLLFDSASEIRTRRPIEGVGQFTAQVTGGDNIARLDTVEASGISLLVEHVVLSGNLLSTSAMDLSTVDEIEVEAADAGVTIGAFSGTDTFDVSLGSSTVLKGPGSFRLVGKRVVLFDTSGLSELEVTATEELVLNRDLIMDNVAGGQGGRVDLHEAALITLAQDITIDTDSAANDEPAGDILLRGASIQSAAGVDAFLTLDATADSGEDGGLIELGSIGNGSMLSGLSLKGGTLELTGDLTAPGGLNLSQFDDVTISGDVTITTLGSNLFFGDRSIDGTGSLVLDLDTSSGASGVLALSAPVGSNSPLDSFTVSADSYSLPEVTTTGNQTYFGNMIFLPTTLTSSGGVIEFRGNARVIKDAQISTPGGRVIFRELVSGSQKLTTLTNAGATTFDKSVFLGGLETLGSVEFANGTQNIQTDGDLTLGELVGRDRVTLGSGSKSIRSLTGDVTFESRVDGPANLSVSVDSSVSGADIPIIRFAGDVGGTTRLKSLTLGDGRSSIPEVATIVAGRFDDQGEPIAGESFSFRTTDAFTMSQNEKLTSLGSLTVEAGSGVATIGDLTSVGPLRVVAGQVDILSRAAGVVAEVDTSTDPVTLLPSAGRDDFGVDFVSGTSISIEAPVIRALDTSLPKPVASEPTGSVKIQGVQTRASNGLTLSQLVFNRRVGTGGGAPMDKTTVLDARGLGSTTVALAQALPSERADWSGVVAPTDQIARPNPFDHGLTRGDQGGVLLRATTPEERRLAMDGTVWYIDMPKTPSPRAGEFSVASARLIPEAAERFRASWNNLAQAVGVESGDRGEVLDRVRAVLGVSVRQYKAASGEAFVDPERFALFADLRSANSDSWRALKMVAAISNQVESFGLTPAEALRFRRGLIESIRPENLDAADVDRLIEYAGQTQRFPGEIEGSQSRR